MKAKEIRELSAEELEVKLVELKKDLFNLRLQHATSSTIRRELQMSSAILPESTLFSVSVSLRKRRKGGNY